MTPEERAMLQYVFEWVKSHEQNPLGFPASDLAKAAIGALIYKSSSTSGLTQSIGTAGATATVPAAYTGKITIEQEGGQFIVPTIA